MKLMAKLFGALIAAVWTSSSAWAGICVASYVHTNPDAWVDNAKDCGIGDDNDVAADIDALGKGTGWSRVDEDNGAGLTDNSFEYSGSSSGRFFIDLNAFVNPKLIVVIKDGAIKENVLDPTDEDYGENTNSNADVKWFWFELDLASDAGCTAPAGYNYCGEWAMYGDNDGFDDSSPDPTSTLSRKNISHMNLYYLRGEGPGPGPGPGVPEPASLALLGIGGLAAAGALRRRRKQG